MREGETSAPHQSGPGGFSSPYACLMTLVRIFVATDEQLEQGVLRDAGEPAPLLKEGTCRADALRRAETGELARGWSLCGLQ